MEQEYKVTIVRREKVLKTNQTEWLNTHKKDEKGEDKWDYLPVPDKKCGNPLRYTLR